MKNYRFSGKQIISFPGPPNILLSLAHALKHIPSRCDTNKHTLTHTFSLSLSDLNTNSEGLTHTHTHTQTHTHTHTTYSHILCRSNTKPKHKSLNFTTLINRRRQSAVVASIENTYQAAQGQMPLVPFFPFPRQQQIHEKEKQTGSNTLKLF